MIERKKNNRKRKVSTRDKERLKLHILIILRSFCVMTENGSSAPFDCHR